MSLSMWPIKYLTTKLVGDLTINTEQCKWLHPPSKWLLMEQQCHLKKLSKHQSELYSILITTLSTWVLLSICIRSLMCSIPIWHTLPVLLHFILLLWECIPLLALVWLCLCRTLMLWWTLWWWVLREEPWLWLEEWVYLAWDHLIL